MQFSKSVTFFITIICQVLWVESRGVNGGMNCAVCTVVSGLVQQEAFIREVSLFEAALRLCQKLPFRVQKPCLDLVNELQPFLIDKRVLNLFTPDVFCYALHSCRIDPGERFCHLFPKPHYRSRKSHKKLSIIMSEYGLYKILNKYSNLQNAFKYNSKSDFFNTVGLKYTFIDEEKNLFPQSDDFVFNFCDVPILKEICDLFLGTFGKLKPALDIDGDGFSLIKKARGSDWRGKDCNDLDQNIYPGAQTKNLDAFYDSNCNGIWGVDNQTGRPWEELLCNGGISGKGLLYLGDSIGAHFHFPEPWMDPTNPNSSSLNTIVEALLNELDWPHLGFATGHANTSHPELIEGSTDSIYLRLRNRDRCSHRDFQNSARNGASARHLFTQAAALKRQPADRPVIVIIGMLGNDVCNRFRDTIAHMTPPAVFRSQVMDTLHVLERSLPDGSDVVLLSLIHGGFVYPSMANRTHPLGKLFNNVRYSDLYNWFTCMQIGPCVGWMTHNATLRNITTEKAAELSDVLHSIATDRKFETFAVHYLDNPFNVVLQEWANNGGHVYELIDPVDSTHPNQKSQPLIAKVLWDSLEALSIQGPPNPHNEEIEQLFGDQGGY